MTLKAGKLVNVANMKGGVGKTTTVMSRDEKRFPHVDLPRAWFPQGKR